MLDRKGKAYGRTRMGTARKNAVLFGAVQYGKKTGTVVHYYGARAALFACILSLALWVSLYVQ